MTTEPGAIQPVSSIRHFLVWLIIGLFAAFAAQSWLDARLGSRAAGLTVGVLSGLRSPIEAQLGEIALWPGGGHDAQIFYQVAVDPLAHDPELSREPDSLGYRYRRILLPFLASSGFTLKGRPLLAGMAITTALGAALTVASASEFVRLNGGTDALTAVLVISSPGWIISSMIFTSDALGLGLAMLGILLVEKRRFVGSAVALFLAALAKEQFVLVGIAMALTLLVRGRPRSSAGVLSGSILGVATASIYAQAGTGSGLTSNGRIGAPFAGLRESIPVWSSTGFNEVIGYAVIGTLAATITVSALKQRLDLIVLALCWAALAVVLDAAVWVVASNAARSLAIIPVLLALAVGVPRRETWSEATPVGSDRR